MSMVFSQKIEELKLKKDRDKLKKRTWLEGDESFHDGSDGHDHYSNRQKFF